MNGTVDFDFQWNSSPPNEAEVEERLGFQGKRQGELVTMMNDSKYDYSNQDFDVDMNTQANDMNDETFIDQRIFNMPGGFKPESMELDESPPFTIDLQYSMDAYTNDTNFANNIMFSKRNLDPPVVKMDQQSQGYSPMDSSSRLSTDANFQHQVVPNNYNDEFRKGSIDSYYTQNNIAQSNVQQNSNINQNQMLGSYNSPSHFPNNNNSTNNVNSINTNLLAELSPITTTTSLTPSVNSMHSTQPSFFSAHQYFSRNSLDQPPASLHGGHFDLFTNRNSIDSQKSTRQGRFNTFSISNMIPFMGDRSQQQPITPPSPGSYLNNQQQKQQVSPIPPQPQSQSRGLLLRTIFKSSNNQNVNNLMNESEFPNEIDREFMTMSPTKEEAEFESPDLVQTKKAKKSKRSLFTRFKTPVKQELEENKDDSFMDNLVENGDFSNFNINGDSENNNYNGDDNYGVKNGLVNGSFREGDNINRNITINENEGLNTSFSTEAENYLLDSTALNTSSQEPDYAALFQNVGRRKMNRKTKTKVKSEPPSDGSNAASVANTERSSIINLQHMATTNSQEDSRSVQSSNTSSLHKQISSGSYTIYDDSTPGSPNNTSSFASASKRILGSKLISKKRVLSKEPAASNKGAEVEVEVDLKSLDLPPDTQIFPTSIINSKSRTRGRKENKQADMVDSSKIYLCNYCSRRFKRQEHLKRHFRSLHTFEKPYDCNICNKKFSRADNLSQHLKIHKQEEEEAAAAGGVDGIQDEVRIKVEAD